MKTTLTLFLTVCIAVMVNAQNFWQQTNGPFGGSFYNIAISPNNSVYTHSLNFVYKLNNGSNYWNTVLEDVGTNALIVNQLGTICVGTGGGEIYSSTDNGNSWNNNYISLDAIKSFTIDQIGNIYAITELSIAISSNNGASWCSAPFGYINSGYLNSLILRDDGKYFIGTDYDGIFRSTDSGVTWQQMNNGLTSTWVKSLSMNHEGILFLVTYDGLFYKSTNYGSNWIQIIVNSGVIQASVNHLGHTFISTYDEGVFCSTDNGNNWVGIGLLGKRINSFAFNQNGCIYVGTKDEGIYLSQDNGINWIPYNDGLNETIFTFSLNQSDDILAGTRSGLYISSDFGENWISKWRSHTVTSMVHSTAINSNGHIFLGTGGVGIYRSTDNGNNWTQINTGLTAGIVRSLALNSNGHVFAGTNNGVYRSTDNGNNWTEINTGLTNSYVSSLAINTSGHVFAGTNGGGVYRSTDNGNNWTQIGLTNIYVYSLAINTS